MLKRFIDISKLQKSVTELEKLNRERIGANFALPSAHHRHEKVFVDTAIELRTVATSMFNLTLL